MKRRFSALAACVGLLWCLLCGCSSTLPESTQQLQVVCTIFPLYDWTQQIVGDVDTTAVTLLIQNGTDMHSYQPSVKDIASIAAADVLCIVGGTSDSWVQDAMKTTASTAAAQVSLLEAADAKEEILVEGMQEESQETDETELDEHLWLSPKRAILACTAICETLCQVDPTHAASYSANCSAYLTALETLDEQYTDALQNASLDTILVADRFPFRYLADDYGLHYYAAFPGCSAETEASFETIVFLSQQLKQRNLPYILTTESSDQSLARTVLEAAHATGSILVLDSLQSVTRTQLEQGESYLSRMEENLDVLQKALG